MDKRLIISWGIVLILILGICFLISRIFAGGKSTNQDLVKQLIAAKDSVIAAKNENISDRERLIEEKTRTYEALQEKDSILGIHSNEKDFQIKQINEAIKNIPNRIARISSNNDSLRQLLSDY